MPTSTTLSPPLLCPRCGARETGYTGCPNCAGDGRFVNFFCEPSDLAGRDLQAFSGGPWGWRDTLPVAESSAAISLGEGGTPCIPLDIEGGELWLKNEGANPTWSHKDRAMSVAVTKAVETGASTIVAPSSGNAGLAAAAYAARAGLRAVILTVKGMPPTYKALLEGLGAVLVAFETHAERYAMAKAAVDDLGWYPVTFVHDRVGGNPFGNAGYKSLAYELSQQFGDRLGRVVVPTCRADLMSGMLQGFQELKLAGLIERLPHLVAAEAASGAAFTAALDLEDPAEQELVEITRGDSVAFSIGSDAAYYQGLHSLRMTNGWPIPVDDATVLAEQRRIGRETGLLIEASAAVATAAARPCAREVPDWVVVAIATSAGFKDPSIMRRGEEPTTVIPGRTDELVKYADEVYLRTGDYEPTVSPRMDRTHRFTPATPT